MAGLVVAQFTAAAIGLAVALAVIRDVAGTSRTVGNFWVDLTRSLVRVFVPLSVIGALVLVSQGAVQNLSGFRTAATLAGGTQAIPGGPVASMEVIKLLGTNGGSFYGAGGAHPFENPTGFTNMFDLLVIVLPFAIALMFGRLIGPAAAGARHRGGHGHHLPRPEGSALMTVGTMGTTAGATDSALDSYTPVGGAGRSSAFCSARSARARTAAGSTPSSCSRCWLCSSPG